MSVTQNEKIRQVTEDSIVVGVDIASESHWARAFDWRGIEYGKAFQFENNSEGFVQLLSWIGSIYEQAKKTHLIIGAEPTGHYWFALAAYLKSSDIKLVLVNPHHVKKSKELDDNHPSKSDRKDPKVIARLVLEGRYSEPYIPEGIYAELRVAMTVRWRILRELTAVKNQIQRWLKIYFPEYGTVFSDYTCVGSMAILREAPMPVDLIALGVDDINAIWRRMKLRAVGKKRATSLLATAMISVGCTEGSVAAHMEIKILLEDYEAKLKQYEEIMTVVEGLCGRLPEVAVLLSIKGIGLVTVAGFLAETGDIRRFDSPRQIQKLAGLAITENGSGKFKGQSSISKRGRSRLRTVLFRAAISLVSKYGNQEFRELHRYYTTREKNPLKKKQSIIAMSCKLIRVFYVLITKDVAYDPVKLLADIHRNQPLIAA
ncbi:IS110 family transposase [Christensenellaceae bacterium OttesenSCG-928-M15]|nr:IS110 family transposase [Christensenellaceae bacterium OttesenSCG-928-M15]